MRIGITGHEIADTVSQSLIRGFGSANESDAFIGYGILRGMDKQFEKYNHWFNVDRGYFNPGHFDGYYRISYKGTQAKWHDGISKKPGEFNLKPIVRREGYVLVCPPTEAVRQFYGIGNHIEISPLIPRDCRIRNKGDTNPIDWDNIHAVITFNSSVGWEALRRGIPVLSDHNHSIIGSYYKETDLDKLIENFYSMPDTRLELFEAMNAHQFTLEQIARGEAWGLINHYLSGSATTHEKPPAPM